MYVPFLHPVTTYRFLTFYYPYNAGLLPANLSLLCGTADQYPQKTSTYSTIVVPFFPIGYERSACVRQHVSQAGGGVVAPRQHMFPAAEREKAP